MGLPSQCVLHVSHLLGTQFPFHALSQLQQQQQQQKKPIFQLTHQIIKIQIDLIYKVNKQEILIHQTEKVRDNYQTFERSI